MQKLSASTWGFGFLLLISLSGSGVFAQTCSNGLCEEGEDIDCPEDCGSCGDLKCDPCLENNQACAEDCYCGDFICDVTETAEDCPDDCLGSICGDLVCDFDEVCALDCIVETAPLCGGGAYCGDGLLDAGEVCDDGNQEDGDCCSALCEFEADLGSCDDDDVCNGQESCAATGCIPGSALNCDDQDNCSADSCDPESGCLHLELRDCVPDPSGEPVANDGEGGGGDDSGVGGEAPNGRGPSVGTLGGAGCSLSLRP